MCRYVPMLGPPLITSQRGNMLGETPLDTGPRSVFDYLSEKDRERLKNVSAAIAAGTPPAAAAFSTPRIEPHIAEAALKGFQPFTSDPAKQGRYTTYLQSQLNPDSSLPPLRPLPNQRPDELQNELENYAKAATIFKPVSGAMAGRFQSASHIEKGPQIREGLHQPTAEDLDALEAQRKKEEEEKISPQAHAAKMGMYGHMTREVMPWQPARLLCKRFGVKEVDARPDDLPEESTSGNGPSFTTSEAEEAFKKAAEVNPDPSSSHPSGGPRNLANIGLGDDELQGQETLTYQRPAMDIFKAIFASDDEDDDNDDDPKDEDKDEPEVVKDQQDEPEATTSSTFGASHSLLDDKPVDLSTFKPTFIRREGKGKKVNDEQRSQDKKEKKKKKKDKKGPLVSFDVDEDGVEGLSLKPSPKERPKKKKKKDRDRKEDDDDEGMWVEKAVPEAVKNLPPTPEEVESSKVKEPSAGPDNSSTSNTNDLHRGRKRAIDFL